MFAQAKRRQGQGVRAVEELLRTVAMSAVTPSADDEPVQVFLVPTKTRRQTAGLTPRKLILNWRTEVASEGLESIEAL
ncbi:hypothetical protein J8I87_36315 [Paraburkholderia sp. LEh10]|uniref:hypothetical protein n=1 Tax=Paraburkholderia sp. LEh10 TaxID=2821353 RepID=UPI001AE9B191|nr:hypothetical protein [Paraburkholderia sp. LEh10]MBP0595033.1 hypothetical protein [Paraburkholderia sp. LEh10]